MADALAGATASRAGTSSARRWRCATSAPRFDIHTGGIDNVFPHHEDEIAQSAPISGEVPARHWVHGEFLLMDGRKMAKSAGNFQRVTELVDRGIDPLAFRYLVLTSRYSRKLEYSDRSIAAAAAALESLRAGLRCAGSAAGRRAVGRAGARCGPGAAGDRPDGVADGVAGHGGEPTASTLDGPGRRARRSAVDARVAPSIERFVTAIDDDLDMPVALALLREILRAPTCRRRTALAHPRRRRRPRPRPATASGPRRAAATRHAVPTAEVTALVEARCRRGAAAARTAPAPMPLRDRDRGGRLDPSTDQRPSSG